MTETAAAPKVAKAKKPSKPKAPAAHPTYLVMASAAISSLKERTGSSRQAILKYIMANYKLGNDSKPVNARLKVALRNGTKKGVLKNAKGTGATGSFKLAEKPAKAKKAKAPKKAKSPKKAKKPAAKKAKTPKKAAKPKKAAAAKKAKSPKKAARPKKAAPVKKSPKKAAKKPTAKKAAKK